MTREERQAWIQFVGGMVAFFMDSKTNPVRTKAWLAENCNKRAYFIRKSGQYSLPESWTESRITPDTIKEAVDYLNDTKKYFIQVNMTPPGYRLIWGQKNNTPNIGSAVENVEHQKSKISATIESQVVKPITITINIGLPKAYEQGLLKTLTDVKETQKKLCNTTPLEAGLKAIEDCANLNYKVALIPDLPSAVNE